MSSTDGDSHEACTDASALRTTCNYRLPSTHVTVCTHVCSVRHSSIVNELKVLHNFKESVGVDGKGGVMCTREGIRR